MKRVRKDHVVTSLPSVRMNREAFAKITLLQTNFEEKIGQFVINSKVPFHAVEDVYLRDILKNLHAKRYGLKFLNKRAIVLVWEGGIANKHY